MLSEGYHAGVEVSQLPLKQYRLTEIGEGIARRWNRLP
jgi:hypothetical protein